MPTVSTAGASVTSMGRTAAGLGVGALARLVVALASAIVLLAAALLVLLQPLYMHPALDAARSGAYLRTTRGEAHRLSDQTVGELVFGPGTFSFAGPGGGPFYDAAEAAHMRDARLVLLAFLGLAAICGVILLVSVASNRRRPWVWQAIGWGGGLVAVSVALAGLFATIAFDRAFEVFHQVFFPGGNWTFDPSRQRLVQLYPLPFWQGTTWVLGALLIGGGLAVWVLARRRARRLAVESVPVAPRPPVASGSERTVIVQ
jgi:hypothetical protein